MKQYHIIKSCGANSWRFVSESSERAIKVHEDRSVLIDFSIHYLHRHGGKCYVHKPDGMVENVIDTNHGAHPVHHRRPVKFRKQGLPKRILTAFPDSGITHAAEVTIIKRAPKVKVLFFKTRTEMRRFHDHHLANAFGVDAKPLGRDCPAYVTSMKTTWRTFDTATGKLDSEHDIVDRRYCALACFVEGNLTAEILAHESTHVGFAWDHRTHGDKHFPDHDNPEENVCYATGYFLNQILTFIKTHKLREV